MNCRRCHHIDSAHEILKDGPSIIQAGKCLIPNCNCKQYLDAIEKIDEELL
ncbi:MAG: hypothetical protein ACT4N5_06990 [Nitrosopumilaceae archaeon]